MSELEKLKGLQLMIVQHAGPALRTSHNEESELGIPCDDFVTSIEHLASRVESSRWFDRLEGGVTSTLLKEYQVMMREARVSKIRQITDVGEYIQAWDDYVSSYLYRVNDVIENLSNLLACEKQHVQPTTDEKDLKLAHPLIFRDAIMPLLEATATAEEAFLAPHMRGTWEARVVSSQIAKMNNMMLAPKYVVDSSRTQPITQSQIGLAIRALKTLFDPNDHLRTVYLDPVTSQGLELEIDASGEFVELENKIAIRRMIDAIIYEAGLNHHEERAKLSFNIDGPNRSIDVSFEERPQPATLADLLYDVATKHEFTGSLDFKQSEAGITGLSIMDSATSASSGGTLGSGHVTSGNIPTLPSGPSMAMTMGALTMFSAVRPVS